MATSPRLASQAECPDHRGAERRTDARQSSMEAAGLVVAGAMLDRLPGTNQANPGPGCAGYRGRMADQAPRVQVSHLAEHGKVVALCGEDVEDLDVDAAEDWRPACPRCITASKRRFVHSRLPDVMHGLRWAPGESDPAPGDRVWGRYDLQSHRVGDDE